MNKNHFINVIAIDDIPLIIEGIELSLSKQANIKFIGSAKNSREAISLLSSNPQNVDVAIIDLNLKEKEKADPFALCHTILKDFPNVKPLVFTIYDGRNLLLNLRKAGVKGYISKNYKRKELVEAIQTLAKGEEYFPSLAKTSSETPKGIKTDKKIIPIDLKERIVRLTKRELEIAKHMVIGMDIHEIAIKLNLSSRTLNTHRDNIYKKLEVKSAIKLIVIYRDVL